MTSETSSPARRPGIVLALLILAGTFVFVSLFVGLYALLGVGLPYIGLLFLLYWAAIRHQDFAEYLPSVIGGVIGIVVGWLLVTAPHAYGLAGSVVAYALLCGILFCFIRGQVKPIGNHCTLLFLLVSTLPELDVARNLVPMLESLLLAAAVMGLVSAGLLQLGRYRARRSASADLRKDPRMTAYAIFIRDETTDPAELAEYSRQAGPSMQGHAVTPLAAYGAYEVLEGPAIEGAVILAFPSMDEARAWYDSPAYQAARQHRLAGAGYRAILVAGLG